MLARPAVFVMMIAVVGLVGASCSDSSSHAHLNGVVQMVGGPAPGIARAVNQGTVEIADVHGRQVASKALDADGRFSVQLDPGTYVVTADANGPSTKTVTVHRDENTDVTLTIDVK